jgi:hypothetical protein
MKVSTAVPSSTPRSIHSPSSRTCSSAKRTPARSFVFSETLNPALTCVRVTDAAGRPVTADTGHLAPGRARCSRTRRT